MFFRITTRLYIMLIMGPAHIIATILHKAMPFVDEVWSNRLTNFGRLFDPLIEGAVSSNVTGWLMSLVGIGDWHGNVIAAVKQSPSGAEASGFAIYMAVFLALTALYFLLATLVIVAWRKYKGRKTEAVLAE